VGRMPAPVAGRVVDETGSVAPRARRTDRPDLEAAAAIRAHAVENVAHAGRAERALVAADPRVGGVGRELPVAPLAVRPQLQHRQPRSLQPGEAPARVISMKQILLFAAPGPFVTVRRPSVTVTVRVPSNQRVAPVGFPLTVGTPSTLIR